MQNFHFYTNLKINVFRRRCKEEMAYSFQDDDFTSIKNPVQLLLKCDVQQNKL